MHFRQLALLLAVTLGPVAASAQETNSQPGIGAQPPPPAQAVVPAPGYPPVPGMDHAGQVAVQNLLPLTPAMIREIERRVGEIKTTEEAGAQILAFPVNSMVNVSFQPGGATTIVQTVHGYPTEISFFDVTGEPWPIDWNQNSNASNVGGGTNCNNTQPASGGAGGGSPALSAVGFYVCVPTKGSNTLTISPMSLVPRGGLIVSLEHAPKPISFMLVAGNGHYDSDISMHVASRGPNAKVLVDTRPGAPSTGTPYLNAMLAGVAPADAVPMSVTGVSPDDVRAWRIGGEQYIRTRHTLMTPAWDASEHGEGGVTIYALPVTPFVLLSVNGHSISAKIEDEH